MLPGRDDLREQPDRQRLVCRDQPPGEDQVERPPQADDARQSLSAAVDKRDAEAPLREPERGSLCCDPQVAPQRQLHAARQAPAGDRGDRGLGRDPACEAERAGGGGEPWSERLDRLQVGPGAERDAARAGEDQDARVVILDELLVAGLEQVGGRPVHGVAPLLAVDREDCGGATALVVDGHLTVGPYQPTRWRILAALWASLRFSSALWITVPTMIVSTKKSRTPKQKKVTVLSFVSPTIPSPLPS